MRLLAIRPRALGDVVLVTPALRALGSAIPAPQIEVLTEARYRPLLEALEGVDALLDDGTFVGRQCGADRGS